MIIRGKEVRLQSKVEHIDELVLNNPPIALMQAQKEIVNMAKIVLVMIKDYKKLFAKYVHTDFKNLIRKEYNVDYLYKTINGFLTALTEKPLGLSDSQKLTTLIHLVSDVERVGDHIINLAGFKKQMTKEKIPFSEEALNDIKQMLDYIENIFTQVIKILQTEDIETFNKIKDLEDQIDELEKQFQQKHVKRLEEGICKPESETIFTGIIRNLERIGDHSNNIAHGIIITNYNEIEVS